MYKTDFFPITNRATILLFFNPSDELWMLPGLIFIKSVIRKDHIFPLCPRFTELHPQKHGLNVSKFSYHLKTNSLFFPPIFSHPWGKSRIAFLNPWDAESSWLVPKRRSEENIYRETFVLELRQMTFQGLWKEAALLKLFNRLKKDVAGSHFELHTHLHRGQNSIPAHNMPIVKSTVSGNWLYTTGPQSNTKLLTILTQPYQQLPTWRKVFPAWPGCLLTRSRANRNQPESSHWL